MQTAHKRECERSDGWLDGGEWRMIAYSDDDGDDINRRSRVDDNKIYFCIQI